MESTSIASAHNRNTLPFGSISLDEHGITNFSTVTNAQQSTPSARSLGTVLVTGANGFVGSNLVRTLGALGTQVVAAMRPGRQFPLESPSDKRFQGSTRALDSTWRDMRQVLVDVDTVIHVAGRVVAPNYRAFLESNFLLTRRLLEAAASMPQPPRFVLISSVAASGPRVQNRPRVPEDPAGPVSLYGRSKLAGERVARHFSSRVPITVLRPGIVFGPGDREVFRLIRLIQSLHINPLAGYSRPKFPFVSVDDLTSSIVSAAERGNVLSTDPSQIGQGVYFVAEPEMISFARFGLEISRALGQRTFLNLPLPMLAVRTAALLSQTFSKPESPSTFNLDKIREADVRGWECDVSKTIHELHWQPAPLRQRITEALDWYRRAGWFD